MFAALQSLDGTLVEGLPLGVYQHVPENAQPPYIAIAAITAEPIGGKDGGLDRVQFDIETWYRGEARRHLLHVQGMVHDRLDGAALPVQPGALLSAPAFEGADDTLLDDGKTYAGTQRFTLIAQPAD